MTDERHSIWLDAPSWFCRPNSTDWQMKLSFVREFSDLQASIVDSWFFNLVYSALYVSIHFISFPAVSMSGSRTCVPVSGPGC